MVRVRERAAVPTCRACLRSAGPSAVPLTLSLLHSYGQLLNAKVSEGDGRPQQLCPKCSKLMMRLLRFREMCLSSEATLMRTLSNQVEVELMENKIKVEPESETNDNVHLALDLADVEAEIQKESDAEESEDDGSHWKDLDALSGEPPAPEHLKDSAGRYPCGLCLNSYSSKKLLFSHLAGHEGERSCGTCSKTFPGWPQLLTHRTRHTPAQPTDQYHCYICSRTFKDAAYLEAHLTFYHFGGTEASCKYCQKTYKSYRNITKHILYAHRVIQDSHLLKCDRCPLKFQTAWQLNKHGKNTHASYICDMCGTKYAALSSLKNHIKKHARQTNSIGCGLCEESPEKHELREHLERHRSDTRCRTCEEALPDWPRLIAHRHVHMAAPLGRYYECYICFRKLRSVDSLETHLRGEHYTGLECKLCGKKLLNARKLSKHLSYHKNLERFRCPVCKNCFSSKGNLLSHMAVHSEDKRFACDKCDFRTHFQQALRNHVKRLHESGSFHCDSCHKIFTSEPALQEHRRVMHRPCPTVMCPHCGIHCKNKAYLKSHLRCHKKNMFKCDMCPSTFKGKDNLIYHINRHNGIRPFKCPHCPATFITPGVLQKHKRIHTGERPYVCKICKKGFMAGHNLKVHMKVHGFDLVVKRKDTLQQPFY